MTGLVPAEASAQAAAERTLIVPELADNVLLAIDTALGCSVALGVGAEFRGATETGDNGEVGVQAGAGGRVYEVSCDASRGHVEMIGTLIARVFTRAGVQPQQLTGVVCGMGPGPFTGLRVGIAAAQTFAAACNVPCLPMQGHDAVALARLVEGFKGPFRVVQDAKRRELFVTDYLNVEHADADASLGSGASADEADGLARSRSRDQKQPRRLPCLPVRATEPRLISRERFVAQTGDVWPERIPAARLVQLAARKLHLGLPFEEDQVIYLRPPDVRPAAPVKRVSR